MSGPARTRAFGGGAVLLVVALLTGTATGSPEQVVADAPVRPITAPVLDLVLTTGPLDGSVTDSIGVDEQAYVLAADVFFAFGSAGLTDRAKAEINRIVGQIRDGGLTSLTVTGHTDSVGSDQDNQRLSQQRAEAVAAQLTSALPGVAVSPVGRGSTELVAEEKTPAGADNPAGRARNRRVEVAGS